MQSDFHVPPLKVHYQPVIELTSGRVVGCEALIRFIRPDGSLVSPAVDGLIDRLEKDGAALGVLLERLFEAVAGDVLPLFDRHPHFYVSVNVPPVTLGSGVIARLLPHLGFERYLDRLVCEITERQAMTDQGRVALAEARRFGVRIAVDDFGTGESGLKQLMGLEFDILKIDRSQVTPLLKDPLAERLLRGVIALAGALRAKVTAEGVETAAQALFVRAAGVDCGQGWYWSKALPIEEFSRVLDRGIIEPASPAA